MDRQHLANLWDQIAACGSRVVLLTGPAGSGKTTAVLEGFSAGDGHLNESTSMLLVPNRLAADDLRQRFLMRSDGGVVVSPELLTFNDLAHRILQSTPDASVTTSLSPIRRRVLLRAILEEHAAAGDLRQLGPLRTSPGLLPAIEAAIAELKRAAIPPDDLARAATAGPLDHDLLVIYRRFQEALHEERLTDVEGRMWLARDALATANGGCPVFAGVRWLLVDGFTEFTPTQLDMLAAASAAVPRVLITLPHQDDGRERLWHWTGRTIELLEQQFAGNITHIRAAATVTTGPGALADVLFCDLDAPLPRPVGLSMIRAAGQEAEIAAVARRIRRLLLDGTPAGRIAVVARTLSDYAPIIHRVFADHGLPVPAPAEALTDTPIIRFLLTVAGLGPACSADNLCAVLTNSYFRPEALGDFDSSCASLAREVLIRQNVLTGREACLQAVEHYRRRCLEVAPRHGDSSVPTEAQVAHAGALLTALFALLDSGLKTIASGLSLVDAACLGPTPDIVARDLRALAALDSALAELGGDAMGTPAVIEALSQVVIPAACHETLVACLDVLDVRPVRYDHVFLIGLNDGAFPSRFAGSPLIPEARRKQWNERGLSLAIRDDLIAREMLLFYLACTRAETALTLSFLDTDAGGGPVGQSPFLTGLLDNLADADAIEVESIPLGMWGTPPGQTPMSRSQTVRTSISSLLDPPEGTPHTIPWPPSQSLRSLRWAARGTFANECRWHRTGSNYDGMLQDVSLREVPAGYPDRTIFSAGRLECYHRCPWQYFATYLLGLEPPVVVRRALDPAARGDFIHRVLFSVLSSLAAECPSGLDMRNISDGGLVAAIDDAVSHAARRLAAQCPPAYEALRQAELSQLRSLVDAYLQDQRISALGLPVHFEWGFGMSAAGLEGDLDPSSDIDVGMFDTPAGPIRLRGRVDRIDRVDTATGPAWAVIDYKTGARPARADIAAGREMQLLLYAEIVSARLGPCVGGAYHRIGRAPQATAFATEPLARKGKPVSADDFASATDNLRTLLAVDMQHLAAGEFPLAPTGGCAAWCPFRRVCQFSAARAAIQQEMDAIAEGPAE